MSGIRIPAGALVLVGDGAKALFLRNAGSERDVQLRVEQVLEHPSPATREQGADKPGRQGHDASRGGATPAGRGATARMAIEQTDWHSLEEARFAAEIAQSLYKAAHAGLYQDLVVVAPPATLGELRKHFHKDVASKIAAEIPKDLTGHDLPHLQRLLVGKP